MKVGKSVKKSIDEWEAGDLESAMLHACNAVDGTARKIHGRLHNSLRFKKLLRDNYAILGPMGMPGVDIETTRFPIKSIKTDLPEGRPDVADIIYGVHRCTHGHGDELPDGFELTLDASGPDRLTTIIISRERVHLSDRIIFGLLAVAVLMPENSDEIVPSGYHLTYGSVGRLEIGEWWGRADDFPHIVALDPPIKVKLDFSNWSY